jgi:hypothetical protein
MCGVTLFPWCVPISLQHPLDCVLQRTDLRLLPFVLSSLWRNRIRDCLAHHPSMHPMLLGKSLDRLSGRIAAPDLFE